MFCFQCQETAKGTGCTVRGVCGKMPETARWQDLLISVVRGIGTIADALNTANVDYDRIETGDYLMDALFTTITNANFDDQAILQRVDRGIALKHELIRKSEAADITLPDYQEVKWGGEKADYLAEGNRESILRNTDEDIRSFSRRTLRPENSSTLIYNARK